MKKQPSVEIQNRAHKLYQQLFGARTREDSIRMIEEAMDDLYRTTKTQTKREFAVVPALEGAG